MARTPIARARVLAWLPVVGLGLGCSQPSTPPPATIAPPTVAVMASGQTMPVGTVAEDAADDPAIWRNDADPSASFIIGTDKKAGLYVYGLDGKVRYFAAAGRLNNVDLRDVRRADGSALVLIGASDRTDEAVPRIALFALETASGKLAALGSRPFLPASHAPAEAYGFCMGAGRGAGEVARAFVVMKDGAIAEVALVDRGGTIEPTYVRSMKVATQAEGCVVDDRRNALFLAEENAAIWRFDLSQQDPTAVSFAGVGAKHQLVADIEGLAIARRPGSDDWLVASSQGDNAFAIFDIDTGQPMGRFRIVDGAIGGTSETDGIEVDTRSFGPSYPDGLMIAQDGDNGNAAQNFKIVDWRRVLEKLR